MGKLQEDKRVRNEKLNKNFPENFPKKNIFENKFRNNLETLTFETITYTNLWPLDEKSLRTLFRDYLVTYAFFRKTTRDQTCSK